MSKIVLVIRNLIVYYFKLGFIVKYLLIKENAIFYNQSGYIESTQRFQTNEWENILYGKCPLHLGSVC